MLGLAREDLDVGTMAVLNSQSPIDWLLPVETLLVALSQLEDIRRHLVEQPLWN